MNLLMNSVVSANRMLAGQILSQRCGLLVGKSRSWRFPSHQYFALKAVVTPQPSQPLFVDGTASLNLPVFIETKGVPVMLYSDPKEVEQGALQQLINIAESPLPVGFVAAMPDVHLGKGVTIGSVFASDKYVCPNAVGVDIGCGMCAMPMKDLYKSDMTMEQKLKIQELVKKRIPTGFNDHKSALTGAKETLDVISNKHAPSKFLLERMRDSKVAKQLGTLGGGNHFLEVVYDDNEQVWILLHSGSRNVGNTTAQFYDELAVEELTKKGVKTRKQDINYLEIDSKSGRAYLGDMQWCQEYAFHNRQYMLQLMAEAVNEVTGADPQFDQQINIHHNFCACERCKYTDPQSGRTVERDLWVTRKGATSANEGQLGIIPGSMGTGSFIVRGKGEPRAWRSCSHGAGRKMSRTKAAKEISQAEFVAVMQGVVCDTHPLVRDEAPQAYKDLTQVMANQRDLVDIVTRLNPLICVKGFGKGGKGK